MKTVEKESTNQVKGEREEFNLTEAFVLWIHESKSGMKYLSGKTQGKQEIRLLGYFNTNKKNPKEPDIRIYDIDENGNQGIEVVNLWENIAQNESRYLTGSTNDNEKIVAWYNKSQDDKRPYIRAYYK